MVRKVNTARKTTTATPSVTISDKVMGYLAKEYPDGFILVPFPEGAVLADSGVENKKQAGSHYVNLVDDDTDKPTGSQGTWYDADGDEGPAYFSYGKLVLTTAVDEVDDEEDEEPAPKKVRRRRK